MTRAETSEGVDAQYWFGTRIIRVVLICAVLVASLLGPACGKVKKWNKETDDLLDRINDPSSSSASTSGGSSRLTVIERKAMPSQTVKDARGRPVKIWGQAKSTSTTPGHDDTIVAVALELASSGKYEYVLMQRSWRTATNRVGTSGRIPDIIGVRHDGRVDAFEIQSNSDDSAALMKRLEEGMNSLPPRHRGEYDVLQPMP